jgi:hypothetical protein
VILSEGASFKFKKVQGNLLVNTDNSIVAEVEIESLLYFDPRTFQNE